MTLVKKKKLAVCRVLYKKIFTKRLTASVSRTNLFVTNAYSDGFLLGLSKPNIVVSNTKDGYLITGFHYK